MEEAEFSAQRSGQPVWGDHAAQAPPTCGEERMDSLRGSPVALVGLYRDGRGRSPSKGRRWGPLT